MIQIEIQQNIILKLERQTWSGLQVGLVKS